MCLEVEFEGGGKGQEGRKGDDEVDDEFPEHLFGLLEDAQSSDHSTEQIRNSVAMKSCSVFYSSRTRLGTFSQWSRCISPPKKIFGDIVLSFATDIQKISLITLAGHTINGNHGRNHGRNHWSTDPSGLGNFDTLMERRVSQMSLNSTTASSFATLLTNARKQLLWNRELRLRYEELLLISGHRARAT